MSLDTIKTGAAALALLAIPTMAGAADMPGKSVRPIYAPPPVHQWTGFYGGVNLGYGLAGISDNTPLAVTSLMHGIIGGAQLGYNYQWGRAVFGIEADIQASDQDAVYTQNLPVVGNLTIGHKIPWFGTVRGRLGYAFTCGCVMAYATGGAAYGAYEPFASAGGITISQRFTRAAWVAGAGVEWMVSERWSAKLEALYMDTGNIGEGITLPLVGTIHMRVRDAITRIGVNYHF